MRLTEAQQERYARHLLLDELGGDGQERLLSSRVRVRGTGPASRWAARYLASSGVGKLILYDKATADECRELSPDVHVVEPIEPDHDFDGEVDVEVELDIEMEDEDIDDYIDSGLPLDVKPP